MTLVFSAEETAREVAETLARKGIENDPAREGAYRFLTTGDPAAFRAMGQRFLQLPIDEVEHVDDRRLWKRPRHDEPTDGGTTTSSARSTCIPDFLEQRARLGALLAGEDARALHGDRSRRACRAGSTGRAEAG